MPNNGSFILGLQSIHQISIFRKPSFPMKISLIFTLIVRANLSLKWQIFDDSVNSIVHTSDIKKSIYHYLLLKETVKLHVVVYCIPSKFWSLNKKILRKTLRSPYHTNLLNKSSLNVHLMSYDTYICFYKIQNTASSLI